MTGVSAHVQLQRSLAISRFSVSDAVPRDLVLSRFLAETNLCTPASTGNRTQPCGQPAQVAASVSRSGYYKAGPGLLSTTRDSPAYWNGSDPPEITSSITRQCLKAGCAPHVNPMFGPSLEGSCGDVRHRHWVLSAPELHVSDSRGVQDKIKRCGTSVSSVSGGQRVIRHAYR